MLLRTACSRATSALLRPSTRSASSSSSSASAAAASALCTHAPQRSFSTPAAAAAKAAGAKATGRNIVEEKTNATNFSIIDSTLREGEQFSTAFFTTEDKIHIATQLSHIGVEYIELVNPMASKESFKDCERIANLGLQAKVLTHTRCHMEDVKAAIASGVDGVNMYMATSETLRQYSHGKGIDHIIEQAQEVIRYCQSHKIEIRFSCEDTFRSDMGDLLKIYRAVSDLGVHRVGIADTVGIATPLQVHNVVTEVRSAIPADCDLEFHAHDDTGCCIANALVAIQAGVTHIDTCVLGIGERNGITPLTGLLARMYSLDKARIRARYNLPLLRDLELFVGHTVGIDVPFNNCVTGSSAFAHKAGVHSKAVIQNPESYEVLDPRDFGVERNISIAHRLTGWNAVQSRAKQLELDISDVKVKEATSYIKNLADTQEVTMGMLDNKLKELAAS